MEDILSTTKQWFVEAKPEPTVDSQRVQLGVHLEEVGEMLDQLGNTGNVFFDPTLASTRELVHMLATQLKINSSNSTPILNKVELLDALCDQIVTATGVAHMYGMDIVGAMQEVNASNFSKFKDGKAVFDANGKITKNAETFFRPDLSKFI